MTSRKKIRANRRNAKKSTGPKTPEGKDKVRCNAFQHGLYSSTLVLDCEDKDLYNELYLGFHSRFRPVDLVELELVDRLVATVWRLRRITAIEAGMLNLAQSRAAGEICFDYPRSAKEDLGFAFHPKGGNEKPNLTEISLQRGRIERAYYRALTELKCLQQERPAGSPAEPLPVTLPFPPRPPDDDLDDIPIELPKLLEGPAPPAQPPPPPSQQPSEPVSSPAASPAQRPVGFVSPTPATPTIQKPNGPSADPQTARTDEVCPPVKPPAQGCVPLHPPQRSQMDPRRRSRRPRSARRRR